MQYAIAQQFQHQDTVAVPIVSPIKDGPATGITITVASPFSTKGKTAQFAIAESMKNTEKGGVSAQEWDVKMLDSLVLTTVAWEGVRDSDGNAVPCEAAHVRDLYEQVPWIREQVQAAVNDRQRFFAVARTA